MCAGCPIDFTDEPVNLPHDSTLAIDWNPLYLRRHFTMRECLLVWDDPSVRAARRTARKQLNFSDCMASFTAPERMNGSNQIYCSKCKRHEDATKTFELWSTPRVLIIHLKRLLAGKKLSNYVDIPLTGFDPSPFLAINNPSGQAAHAAAVAAANKATASSSSDDGHGGKAAGGAGDDGKDDMGVGGGSDDGSSNGVLGSDDDNIPLSSPLGGLTTPTTMTANTYPLSSTSASASSSSSSSDINPAEAKHVDGEDGATQASNRPPLYDLVAVVNHLGSAYGGHYIAAALNIKEKQWYKYDDTRVTPIPYVLH